MLPDGGITQHRQWFAEIHRIQLTDDMRQFAQGMFDGSEHTFLLKN
jgi:hypothetical protein